MRLKTRTPSVQLAEAHELIQQGKREDAYRIVNEILRERPNHVEARALRDRLDSEDLSRAVVYDRMQSDSFEEEDESPVVAYGILAIGIAFALVATYLAIRPIQLGFTKGFTSEIEMGGRIFGKGRYPVHFLLFIPSLMYIGGAICFWSFRRHMRRR